MRAASSAQPLWTTYLTYYVGLVFTRVGIIPRARKESCCLYDLQLEKRVVAITTVPIVGRPTNVRE